MSIQNNANNKAQHFYQINTIMPPIRPIVKEDTPEEEEIVFKIIRNSYVEALESTIIVFFCPNCGNHVVAELKYTQYRPIKDHPSFSSEVSISRANEIAWNETRFQAKNLKNSAICPCCNFKLLNKDGYCIDKSSSYFENATIAASKMRKIRLPQIRKQCKKDVASFIQLCEKDCTIPNYQNARKIKDSPELLNTYLLNILQTEASILSVAERLETLYLNRIENNRFIESEKNSILFELNSKLKEAENLYNIYANTFKTESFGITMEKVILPSSSLFVPPAPPLKPEEPGLKKPGLFNKKQVMKENNLLIVQYKENLQKYELELENYNTAVSKYQRSLSEEMQRREAEVKEKYNKAIADAKAKAKKDMDDAKIHCNEIKTKIEIKQKELESTNTLGMQFGKLISEEIQMAETTLKGLVECRKKLYGCNIIFEKYQDIVALTTFSEYLASGRCDSLEGANGAYNLYESEIRTNTIISSLSQITISLEKIKNNQYMIYQTLTDMNKTLKRLDMHMYDANQTLKTMDNKLGKIQETNEVIAYNTQATAYYSKLNAELTNSLGYLIALT